MRRTSPPVGVGTLMYVGDAPEIEILPPATWRKKAAIAGGIALLYACTGKRRPFRMLAGIAGVGALALSSGVLEA